MGEEVQSTSVFEIFDDEPIRLEAIVEMDTTSAVQHEYPITVRDNPGVVSTDQGENPSKEMKKVRHLTNRKPRKLPALSSPPGFNEPEVSRESDAKLSTILLQNGSANGGHHLSNEKFTGRVRNLSRNKATVDKGEKGKKFLSKAQLFDQGEGAALLRRGLKKNLYRKRGKRKLPTLPVDSMDIIEKVEEANKTFFNGIDENSGNIELDEKRESICFEEGRSNSDEKNLQKLSVLSPILEGSDDENGEGHVSHEIKENETFVNPSTFEAHCHSEFEEIDTEHSLPRNVKSDLNDEINDDHPLDHQIDQFIPSNAEHFPTRAVIGSPSNHENNSTSNVISSLPLHPAFTRNISDFEINQGNKVPDTNLGPKTVAHSVTETKFGETSERVNGESKSTTESLGHSELSSELRGQEEESREDRPVHTLENSRGYKLEEESEVRSDEQQHDRIMSGKTKEQLPGGDSPRGDNQLFHMLLDEYEDDFDEESTSRSISMASDGHEGQNDRNDQNFEGEDGGALRQVKLRRADAIEELDEKDAEEEGEERNSEIEVMDGKLNHRRERPEIIESNEADNSEHNEASKTGSDAGQAAGEISPGDGSSLSKTEINNVNDESIDNAYVEVGVEKEMTGTNSASSMPGKDVTDSTSNSYTEEQYVRDVKEISETGRQGSDDPLHTEEGGLSIQLERSGMHMAMTDEVSTDSVQRNLSFTEMDHGTNETSVDSGVLNDDANIDPKASKRVKPRSDAVRQGSVLVTKTNEQKKETTNCSNSGIPHVMVNKINSGSDVTNKDRSSAISKQVQRRPTSAKSRSLIEIDGTFTSDDNESLNKEDLKHALNVSSTTSPSVNALLNDTDGHHNENLPVEFSGNMLKSTTSVTQESNEGRMMQASQEKNNNDQKLKGSNSNANVKETERETYFESYSDEHSQKKLEMSLGKDNNDHRIEQVIDKTKTDRNLDGKGSTSEQIFHNQSERRRFTLQGDSQQGKRPEVDSQEYMQETQETLTGSQDVGTNNQNHQNGINVHHVQNWHQNGDPQNDSKATKEESNDNPSMRPRKSALKASHGDTKDDHPPSNDVELNEIETNTWKAGEKNAEDKTPDAGIDSAKRISETGGAKADVDMPLSEKSAINAGLHSADVKGNINDNVTTPEMESKEPRKRVIYKKRENGIAVNGQQRQHSDSTNRHEGHSCPRELRRLERLKEQQMLEKEATTEQRRGQESEPSGGQSMLTESGQRYEGDGEDDERTFPGQGSQEAASSPLIMDSAPPKKRRKKKSDPFDGLPVIKPWHLHQQEQNTIKEKSKGRRRQERRFKVSQFEDPFKQMLWMLFRSADKDGNNKLNKKELGLILQSPKLELSLTQADVKKLFGDCCSTDEDSDPKTHELSFEEFVPLGRFLLIVYYSKLDESSQSKWCILDKGRDCGVIYFNKLTGDASTTIPSDYYGDIQHEPDLFEVAIHDLFEDADINEDGKINVIDFLRILRSEDFGLFLTNVDAEEILQYFTNTRGREIMVSFDEFVPLAKRMILTVYRARDPSPHQWCHLYTKNVGSFWFNKVTGQADRHPPTSLVRTQQDLLEHRSRELEVFMEVAEDLHHTREKLQQETQRRQELEQQLAELTKEHDTTKKELSKTTSNLEKSREEVEQKSKQIIYFEKEKVKHKNLIESLRDRAEEADRIEANLESLRNVLQSTQSAVREKEFDVRDLSGNLEERTKELANSREHAANLQDKIDDLVIQLRDEIRRNERVEKELETTKSYKNEKVEVEDILKETKEELQMRMNQLTHARYEIRDSKSRIRKLETELNNYPNLENQLAEKDKEISQLKEEMQRLEAQMMEDIRRETREPRPSAKRYRWNKVQNVELWDKSHDCSDPSCPINGRNSATAETSQVWAFKQQEKGPSHPNVSFLELLNHAEHGEDMMDTDELNIYNLYEPQQLAVSPHRVRASSASGDRSKLARPKSSIGRIETRRQSRLPKGVLLYEEDYLLARFVKEGDRVRIKKSGVQILGMKPSDLRTATVRYVGQLDQEGGEHMLFVGLHMDDPVGNTNGILEGKRYFYTKRKHGKMVRITEVLYIYNPKTTSFDKLSDLIEEYKASRRKQWQQSPVEGSRLIKVT